MTCRGFRLFVGLGNPGGKYKETRHNIGFMALQRFAAKEGVSFSQNKKLNGLLAQINSQEKKFLKR